MEYEITTRTNMRIEVFDTPVAVAEWIAELLPELDYIQESDIVELTRDAVAVALHRKGVRASRFRPGRYVSAWWGGLA